MKEHREREIIKGMRKNINKTDDPKNDDNIEFSGYFIYQIRGCYSSYIKCKTLKEAISKKDNDEVYMTFKIKKLPNRSDPKRFKSLKDYNIK